MPRADTSSVFRIDPLLPSDAVLRSPAVTANRPVAFGGYRNARQGTMYIPSPLELDEFSEHDVLKAIRRLTAQTPVKAARKVDIAFLQSQNEIPTVDRRTSPKTSTGKAGELWAGIRDPRDIHVTQRASAYNPDAPEDGFPDCAPASTLMAMYMLGHDVPGALGTERPSQKIDLIRHLSAEHLGEPDYWGGVPEAGLAYVLELANLRIGEATTIDQIREAVRRHSPTVAFGDAKNYGSYGHYAGAAAFTGRGRHAILVSGLNLNTGDFIINDPNSTVGPMQITPGMLASFLYDDFGFMVSEK